MGIAETFRLNGLMLKDLWGFGRTRPGDNRKHLDAAIAWLKHAQDVTGNGGVAQTYLVRSRRWAPSYPETTGYLLPTLHAVHARHGGDSFDLGGLGVDRNQIVSTGPQFAEQGPGEVLGIVGDANHGQAFASQKLIDGLKGCHGLLNFRIV